MACSCYVRQVRSNIRHSTFANYPQRLVFFKCHRISSININLRPKALPSITADAIFLLPVRRKWPPNVHGLSLWRRLFSIAAYDGGNFRISRQNQSPPGTTRLPRYKRCHISTSGLAQIVAELAQLEPMGKKHSPVSAQPSFHRQI